LEWIKKRRLAEDSASLLNHFDFGNRLSHLPREGKVVMMPPPNIVVNLSHFVSNSYVSAMLGNSFLKSKTFLCDYF
jgi:hypothetical protein